MPRENRTVVLDADLALDRRGKQIAQDAQHRRHRAHAQQHQIVARLYLDAEDVVPGGQQRVDQRQHTAGGHAAQHAAHRALYGLVGADDGGQLVLAESAAREIRGCIPAPGEAQDQQDKVDGVIAVLVKRQHPL